MRARRLVKLVSLCISLALIGVGFVRAAGVGQGASVWQMQQGDGVALRTGTINSAVLRNDLFDCETYAPEASVAPPAQQQILHVGRDTKITPSDGRDYTAATWSPTGEYVVFVSPTKDARPIPAGEIQPLDLGPQVRAISKNSLKLYTPARNMWEDITDDGASPVWSADGRAVYYIAGTDLFKFEIDGRTISNTGHSAPNTAVGLLVSQPLPDGTLLAPSQPGGPLHFRGGQVAVAQSDRVLVSPKGDSLVVAYGASPASGRWAPAVTTLHNPSGAQTPLLKNCQSSASQMVWSPTGRKLAYPVRASRSEIRVYDLTSGTTQVPIGLDTSARLNGLSWAPDENYLAFSVGDGRSTPRSIWVTSASGTTRQQIAEGLLPNWSPQGNQILYARPGTGQLLDWHLLDIALSASQTGGN